ncbi:MAG: sulfatase [Verrucomicrobiota bacterium JB024]|nr:sulfatase [Verrucomicrobiota bacterium JB024]
MNIVYLHAHDAGRIIQPYGYPVETPHLMNFARESVLFRKAFCVSPTCGPSRAALLTGQYPHQIGMYGLPGFQGWALDDPAKHWARQFRAWGYETILAGVQHEADHHDFSSLGYECMLENQVPARSQAGEFYPETITKVESLLATRPKGPDVRPFFLSVGIDEPHRDNIARPEMNLHGEGDRFSKTRYYDPAKLDARYTAPLPWLPDLPEVRQDMESYRVGVKIMDEYMGRVLDALRHNGYDDNTLVIVTTDHGIEFPGGKKTLSDQGTEVMLMVRGPESHPLASAFRGGRVIEPLVTHLDLYPTLCELLGRTVAHPLEGKSMLPLVRGEVSYLHEAVFAEQTYHGKFEPLRSIRTERYKYIRRHFPNGPIMTHDGPASPIVQKFGWYDRPIGHEELFDLYLDPMEACNRIDDPSMAEVRGDLAACLEEHLVASGDPFLSGEFPSPCVG